MTAESSDRNAACSARAKMFARKIWPAVGLLFAIDCGRNDSAGVTNRQRADMNRVVEELSAARCDQQEKCDRIGEGRRYNTRAVCMDELRGDTANQINAYACPRGIDEAGIEACVRSLGEGGCSDVLEAVQRQMRCRDSALCLQ